MKTVKRIVVIFLIIMLAMHMVSLAETNTCKDYADGAEDVAAFTELTEVNRKYLEKYLLIDAEDLTDWSMRRDATRATPEMILFLEVAKDADLPAILKAVQDYHDEQTLQYRDYQPDQFYKLENAHVLQNGNFIALVVSPDAAKIESYLGRDWH